MVATEQQEVAALVTPVGAAVAEAETSASAHCLIQAAASFRHLVEMVVLLSLQAQQEIQV